MGGQFIQTRYKSKTLIRFRLPRHTLYLSVFFFPRRALTIMGEESLREAVYEPKY